jgi:hypothetical protein
MSTVLKLKRSSQSGNAPDTDNIVEGELALNTADKILYSRGGSTIFQIGANITESFTVNPGTAADTITLGATAQEGTITIGQSTATNTINIGNAVTANEATQTINIGGGNASGGDTVLNLAANTLTASNTAVTIGCSNSTGSHTVAIRGASTFTNGAVAFNGGNFTVNPNSTSDTINIGKITGTGTITLGKSTKDNTIDIGNATTESDQEQIINIGSGSGSGTSTVNIAAKNSQGSDTAVTIGGADPTFGTTTVAIRGNTTFQYGDTNFNGHNFTITPVLASRTITIGKTTGTGTITLGNSTVSQNISIGSGATTVTNAATIDIGSNLASGGVKTVNICAGSGNSGSRYVNINSSLQSTGQNYLNGATKIRRTSGVPLIVESTSTSTNTTQQGLQLLNTNTTSFFRFGNFSSLAQVQSYHGSGSGASIQFLYGSNGEKHRLDASGKFGIGVSSPLEALHVNGNIIATGNVTAYYSDERLKDFKGAIPDALDKVNKLTGYYYKPNALAHSLGVDNTELEVGVSAQEVEEVLPEIVTKSAVGQDEFGEDYKSVSYDKLTPLLIEAVKELTQKVAYLESKISEKGE